MNTPPPLPKTDDLVLCSACHGEIKKSAEKCRHCGKRHKLSYFQLGCLVMILAPVGYIFLSVLIFQTGESFSEIGSSSAQKKPNSTQGTPTPKFTEEEHLAAETQKKKTEVKTNKDPKKLAATVPLKKKPAPKKPSPPKKTPAEEDKAFKAFAILARQGIKSFRNAKTPKSFNEIDATLVRYAATLAMIQVELRTLKPRHKTEMQKIVSELSKAQSIQFPKMRDAFGPISRQILWENDITVVTVGKGYKTAKFTGHIFASNRGIKLIQESVHQRLMDLRFKRAEYRWYREADRYQYYTLETPNDSQVGYRENGEWHNLKI